MLTRTRGWVSNSSAAYIAAGPDPTIATLNGPRRSSGAGMIGASFEVGGSFVPGSRSG